MSSPAGTILRLFDPDEAARARGAGSTATPAVPAPKSQVDLQTLALEKAASVLARWVPQAVTTRDLANLFLEAGEDSGVYVRFFRFEQSVPAGSSTTATAPVLAGIVQQLWVAPGSSTSPMTATCSPASALVTATIQADNSTIVLSYPMDQPVSIDSPVVLRDFLSRTYKNASSADVVVSETIALLNIEKTHDSNLFQPFSRLQIANIRKSVSSSGPGVQFGL